MVIAISARELTALLEEKALFFVSFWQHSCLTSLAFAKIYAKVAKNYSHLTFASLQIKSNTKIAQALSIRSTPHLLIGKAGMVIYSEVPTFSESALYALVEQALSLEANAMGADEDASW